jgi:DNA helicase II / ATP-dependent DNA helicase PcrA
VFFLGLESQQWWAHSQDVPASISTFFVGLSRAAQRLIFTRCFQRGDTDGITEFYKVLDDAGVAKQVF